MSFAFTGADATAAKSGEVRTRLSRRERQLVEILLLWVTGDHRRAAALAAEHVGEFADDAVALTIVDRWFGQRQCP